MEEFVFVKSLSASIGLIIFMLFFLGLLTWVYRPSAKNKFEGYAKSILDEEKEHDKS